jgi:hypothetical protein
MRILPKKLLSVIKHWRQTQEKTTDLQASASIDISQVKTVCLAMGPYRNLTTLTASILFLHPNCQVLNHGAERIFGDNRLDFLLQYSKQAADNFIRYAIYLSGHGSRGKQGGSITLSHAFDGKHKIQALYNKQFGDRLIKEEINAVFWKESLRTSFHLRKHAIDLQRLFEQEQRLRFLLPIRNPIDCALSNQKTGHAKLWGLGQPASVEDILEQVLDEIHWFYQLQQQYPTRFFHYLENKFNHDTVVELADFLCLKQDPEWQEAVLEAFDISKHYEYPAALVDTYASMVENKFEDFPEMKNRLLAFIS